MHDLTQGEWDQWANSLAAEIEGTAGRLARADEGASAVAAACKQLQAEFAALRTLDELPAGVRSRLRSAVYDLAAAAGHVEAAADDAKAARRALAVRAASEGE